MEDNSPNRAETSLDAVYVVDGDFNVHSMNHSARVLGAALQKPGELPEAVIRVLREKSSAHERKDAADGRGIEVVSADPLSGKSRTFVSQLLPLSAGPGTGWVVVLKDVTSHHEQNTARTKAMSTLGHEVRTPVSSIRMVLHLLLEEKVGPLSPDQRELVAAGHEDCERLLTILQALLELARFEGGRATLKRETLLVEDLLASSGLTTEPAPGLETRMEADRSHLVRALKIIGTVLLPGGTRESPTVRVESPAPGRIRVSVRRGTSRPLSETERDRMFEPFGIKAENDPEKSGLSLAIAREIVAAHGGRLTVTSDEHSVEFILDLPSDGSDHSRVNF